MARPVGGGNLREQGSPRHLLESGTESFSRATCLQTILREILPPQACHPRFLAQSDLCCSFHIFHPQTVHSNSISNPAVSAYLVQVPLPHLFYFTVPASLAATSKLLLQLF